MQSLLDCGALRVSSLSALREIPMRGRTGQTTPPLRAQTSRDTWYNAHATVRHMCGVARIDNAIWPVVGFTRISNTNGALAPRAEPGLVTGPTNQKQEEEEQGGGASMSVVYAHHAPGRVAGPLLG